MKYVSTYTMILLMLVITGCTYLFGWNIHAPGILSAQFYEERTPADRRVALYVNPAAREFQSDDKGDRFADPKVFNVGEAFYPMIIEAFQASFTEFVLIDVEPTDAILKQHSIPYLVAVDITGFDNRGIMKAHSYALKTEVYVFDSDLNLRARFEAERSSEAQKLYGKKGAPEVNLNAAVENNIKVTVEFLHDLLVGEYEEVN